jgi:hypothetical protein
MGMTMTLPPAATFVASDQMGKPPPATGAPRSCPSAVAACSQDSVASPFQK